MARAPGPAPRPGTRQSPQPLPGPSERTTAPEHRNARPQTGQAHLIASTPAAAGKPASRQALRAARAKGSNKPLNALARNANAELETEER